MKKDLPYYLSGLTGIVQYELHFSFVTKEVFDKRLDSCKNCCYIRSFNPELKKTRCGICGCSLKKKMSLKNRHCPKNRW